MEKIQKYKKDTKIVLPIFVSLSGAPSQNRTEERQIKSLLLYQFK